MKSVENRVVATKDSGDERTAGGIILMSALETIMTVVAVGPKVEGVSVGDRIVLPKEPSQSFTVEGVKYYSFDGFQILGVL